MLWVILSIASCLSYGLLEAGILLMAFLISRKNRDIAIFLYSLYLIAIVSKIKVRMEDPYIYDLEAIFLLSIPSILSLGETLSPKRLSIRQSKWVKYTVLGMSLAGLFLREVLILAMAILLMGRLKRIHRKEAIKLSMALFISALLFTSVALYFPTASAELGGPVVFGVFLIYATVGLRSIDKVDIQPLKVKRSSD